MQVLGTVNIGQNIENAQNCEINNFQNSSQHKSTVNVQPQIATPVETSSQVSTPEVKQIRLNPDIDKIDFIRVINAMCELRMFTTTNGLIADKKDVFAAFGTLLDQYFARFSNNLNGSVGTSSVNNNKATEKVFENLKEAAIKFSQRVIDNRQR